MDIEHIKRLEQEVKEKQQEIEYCTSQSRLDILEEEVYNTKQSIKELRKYVGS
jgi:wobble nucleotide-excising tRNase